jgi:hypothetical protein
MPSDARRPRGRPRTPEPKATLSAWVPTTDHDRIALLALKHDVSVSKIVRRLLEESLRKRPR